MHAHATTTHAVSLHGFSSQEEQGNKEEQAPRHKLLQAVAKATLPQDVCQPQVCCSSVRHAQGRMLRLHVCHKE